MLDRPTGKVNQETMFHCLLLVVLTASGVTPNRIDELLVEAQKKANVTPAAVCDDATFLRRVSLDLIGRIPTVSELDAFLAAPNREKKIDELLADPLFSRRFAEVWTAGLVGYTRETEGDRFVLLQWLERQIQDQKSFRQIAHRIITAEGQAAIHGPVNFVLRHEEDTSVQVCRQFLGIRLDCARCHDHPFAKWTQEDFTSMARFFERIRTEEVSERNLRVRDQPAGANDEKPRFLSGAQPQTSQWRAELSLFVTRSKPFARNFANRIWYDLMGRGIVDPPDDFNPGNEPASRELLELLAKNAREHDFDIRHMYRLICNSETYQRVSAGATSPAELRLFAKRRIKPLTPEQIFDSRRLVLGDRGETRTEFLQKYRGETFDEDFLETWKFRETTQTMLQQVTDNDRIDSTVPTVRAAYRRALSREPTPADREAHRASKWSPNAVLTVLLQTNEFVFNH